MWINRHVTKVGIVGIIEPVLSDESHKIVDVHMPALRVVEQTDQIVASI
jgi:hypothetical protein